MTNRLVTLWRQHRSRIKNGWLIIAGLAAIYYGAIQPGQAFHGIAQSRSTGLAAIAGRRHEHWFQPSLMAVQENVGEGIVGGVPGGAAMLQQGADANEADRKIVRTSSIALVVDKPAEAAAR